MIPELGHYALVLALALGLIQSVAPVIGAIYRDGPLMRLANSTALMQFVFVAPSFAGADDLLRDVRFLGGDRLREFALDDAAGLQDHQRLGKPRGLDAAVGADPGAVRRAGRRVRRQPAGDA